MFGERKINTLTKDYKEQLPANNPSAIVYYIKVMDEKGKPVGTGNLVIR
ncbi:MAG: hypothetical protein IPP72_12995 [Chitinophagaceae bacterium]|nr:hypothetical protein [Chitinophagaceae bacterium]